MSEHPAENDVPTCWCNGDVSPHRPIPGICPSPPAPGPDPAEEFEGLRRLGPKLSRAQWSRMQELGRILDDRETRVIPPDVPT